MIAKLLIANRGEIACRIVRTARRMGIATVAVFSEADRDAPHVRAADEAVAIGPAEAAKSYLDLDAVIGAARTAGADAIHPGYGFLSENAGFARACGEAGFVFVGPSPEAIALMGDKRAARRHMVAAGVPVVPGYDGPAQDEATLAAEAARIGFPVLVKAAAGGGGRGMRIVGDAGAFPEALASARREAKAAFGDDAVLLERLITGARHVEVQVFGDRYGNVVHLFERDCSTQRRHQKVIEESPSPIVDAALRARLGNWAVAAAASVSYEGAGTVEFVVDQAGEPFFLEMNTRLQVEHPVTEMVTGIDLVEWQLRIAAGEPLPLAQDEISLDGHAVEARLYAENPYDGFGPQAGRVSRFRPPHGEGWRIDAGIAEGGTVSAHYDPMVAKLIAHGRDRAEAIDRLTGLVSATPLVGIAGNGGFLRRLLETEVFRSGNMTTATIDAWVAAADPILDAPVAASEDFAVVAAVAALAPGGSWFRSTGVAEHPVALVTDGVARTVRLLFERGRLVAATTGETAMEIDAVRWDGEFLSATLDGRLARHRVFVEAGRYSLVRGADILVFEEPDPLARRRDEADARRIVSPVAGRVSRVLVRAGDPIAAGGRVATVEAMKLETALDAAGAGTVTAVHVSEGDQVQAGDLVAEIEPEGCE